VTVENTRARLAQFVEQRSRRRLRSVGVVDDVDRDAGGQPSDQQIGKMLVGNPDVLDDEVFEVDVIARTAHRIEHGWQRLLAIAQQAHLVPRCQRAVGQRLLQGELPLQDGGAVGALIGNGGVSGTKIVVGVGHGRAGCQRCTTGQCEKPTAAQPFAHAARQGIGLRPHSSCGEQFRVRLAVADQEFGGNALIKAPKSRRNDTKNPG
jgi:hypothetical protein